jgi:RNA polymerase sigma-70 factor (ECF subfamily)
MPDTIASQPDDEQSLVLQISKSRDGEADCRAAHRALSALYEVYARRLVAFIAARSPRDIEDIHQTVWMRVWEHAPTKYQGGNFAAWLFTIARNQIIDRTRRARPYSEDLDVRPDPCDTGPLEQMVEKERRRALEDCMQKLDEKQADVFRSRMAREDYSMVASRLNVTVDEAYKMLHKAKDQLRDCMKRANL